MLDESKGKLVLWVLFECNFLVAVLSLWCGRGDCCIADRHAPCVAHFESKAISYTVPRCRFEDTWPCICMYMCGVCVSVVGVHKR